MENKWEITARKAWETILAKIKKMHSEGMSQQEIATLVGVGNRAVISEWLKGNRKAENTSFANLMSYLERLGLDYQDYFPNIKRSESKLYHSLSIDDNSKPIPVYAVAGAGPGILPDQLEPLFTVIAPPEYFRRSNYAVVVSGHSMEPRIPNGSIVGIILDAPFQANELYLADIPYEGFVIKRVGVDMKNDEFIFKSDNPDKEAYPDFRISIHEAEKIIIGKVVWVMVGY